MSRHTPSYGAALRAFVVLISSVLMVTLFAMDLRRLWFPLGVFGYQTNADGVVISADNNSPAAKAGIQIGDRVDVSSTPPQFRPYVVQATFVWEAGQNVTFGLIHKGIRHSLTLTAVPQRDVNNIRKVFWIIKFAGAVLFIVIGSALVLLRPSLMTCGFFFYCLAFAPGSWTSAWSLPYPGNYVADVLFNLVQVAGLIGLLVFAICFLSQPGAGWRFSALRLMPWLFFALFAFWNWTFYQDYWIGGPPGELFFRTLLVLVALASLVALYGFIDTYVRARGTDRQRMRWVIVGFGVSLAASYIVLLLELYSPATPSWVLNTLTLCNIFVPLSIAYAVMKHRVIDVNFVVSRALVYAVLTTLLVGVFSVIDWFFGDYLRLARLGTIAEVGAAVALGVWFNSLHKRVDALVDATFFRQRHAAERQLARNAAALPFAATTNAIALGLVAEPVRALSLASAALFRPAKDGAFVREDAVGWASGDASRLDPKDEYCLTQLLAENGPLLLDEAPLRTDGLPAGPARPVLALPIAIRRELVAVVLYGAHVHGEALDPDEIRAIAGLATGASAAYDHVKAESMKQELESMKTRIESLQADMAELRAQPV